MTKVLALSGVAVLAAGLAPGPGISARGQQGSPERALLNRYCVTCHNDRAKTGGLTLAAMDVDHPAADAEVWEKAIRKLRAGLMPPSGAPRPDRATLGAFRHTIEAS